MARSSSSRSPSPSIGMNKIRLKLSNLMLKLTNPLLTRAESEAISVFRFSCFAAKVSSQHSPAYWLGTPC
jgi:hypothetical protein